MNQHRRRSFESPTYRTWRAMKERCSNPNHRYFYNYGGRGISVCERWQRFEAFLEDMGERPMDCGIDRINNDGNYEPGNCRWATRREQSRNMRTTKLEPHEPDQIRWLRSEGFSARRIGRFFGIGHTTVFRIIDGRSWNPNPQPIRTI